jgi:hypothetical protein
MCVNTIYELVIGLRAQAMGMLGRVAVLRFVDPFLPDARKARVTPTTWITSTALEDRLLLCSGNCNLQTWSCGLVQNLELSIDSSSTDSYGV